MLTPLQLLLAFGSVLVLPVNAANIGTITLADEINYIPATTLTSLLPGSAIVVAADIPAATGIPSNGLDVHLGADLKKQLDTVVKTACSDNDHSKCYNQVRSLLASPDSSLEVRQIDPLSLVIAAVFVAVAAIFLQMQLDASKKEIQADLHLPAAQLHQASSIYASSVSVIALATGSASPFATITAQPTLTLSPAPALITPAVVTTYAADAGGHKKDDVVFSITEDQARRWSDLIGIANTTDCDLAREAAHSIMARQTYDPLLPNVLCTSDMLLANMQAQGVLAGLRSALPQRFNWRDDPTNQAMHLVQGRARQYAAEFEVDSATADRYGIAAFALARAVIIDHNSLIGDGKQAAPVVVAADAIDLAHPPAPVCQTYTTDIGLVGCRFQGAIEACTTAYTTTKTCLDTAPTTNQKRAIITTFIVPWTVSESAPYADPTPAPSPTSGVKHINQGDLTCGTRTDVGNAAHFVDRDMMVNAANFFCGKAMLTVNWQQDKVADSDKKREVSYNDHQGDPVYVSAEWVNAASCPVFSLFSGTDLKSLCLERLMNAIDNCDTSNTAGHYWWKQGGSFFRDCISWTIRRDTWADTPFASVSPPDKQDDSWRPLTHTCSRAQDCGDALVDKCGSGYNGRVCQSLDNSDQKWCQCG